MKRHIDALVREALSDAIQGGLLRTGAVPSFTLDAPRHASFGDLACDVALVLGRHLGRSPHAIGAAIAGRLQDPHGWLAEVGVAGPGFVNFRFAPPFWRTLLAEALDAGGAYGRSDAVLGRRVRVELFGADAADVIGARGAAVADGVAGLLGEAGAVVERVGTLPGLAPPEGDAPGPARLGQLVGVVAGDHAVAKPRLAATLAELGGEDATLRVLPVHHVRPTRDGSPIGDPLTAGQLLDEIGSDAVRFLCLLERAERPLDLDVELAKRERTDNPLFLVHYAHARLARRTHAEECTGDATAVQRDLSLLGGEDLEVLRAIAGWPDVVDVATRELEPDRIARFAVELAGATHRWLNRDRPDGVRPALARARCALAGCLEQVFRRALALCNVSALGPM
jgi:arginyl-tRNA synthetase